MKHIEYTEYLAALDTVRAYREQQRKSELNKNSRYHEWKDTFQKRTIESIERLFYDGFFTVRSGFLRDLSVKNLAEHTETQYRAQEGVGSAFIRDVRGLCKRAGFILEE